MNSMKTLCSLGMALFAIVALTFNVAAGALQKIEAGPDSVANGENLTRAITQAVAGDTILLGAGVYLGNFEIKAGVAIYGGFKGEASTWDNQTSERDSTLTICDGNANGSVFYTNPYSYDFNHIKLGILDGLTIQNANYIEDDYSNLSSNGAGVYGGGMRLVLVNNCILQNNIGRSAGGMSHGKITNSILINNQSDNSDYGGNATSYTEVINCTIANHQGQEACLYSNLTNCIIVNNTHNFSPLLFQCSVKNSLIVNNDGNANLIQNSVLTDCIIWGNSYSMDLQEDCLLKNCAVASEHGNGILVTLDFDNESDFAPHFNAPTSFTGADADRLDEILAADWNMGQTVVLKSQASFLSRTPFQENASYLFTANASEPSGWISIGKSVSISADSSKLTEGHVFSHWEIISGNIAIDTTLETLSFEMPADDLALRARFKQILTYLPEDPTDSETNGIELSNMLVPNPAGDLLVILLGEGTYLGNFSLGNGVSIYGGFRGNDVSQWRIDDSTRDRNLTVCDGNMEGPVFSVLSRTMDSPILDGITIQNGLGISGGIYVQNYSTNIINITYVTSETMVCVNNCKIINNMSNEQGAASYCEISNALIANNSLYGELVSTGGGGGACSCTLKDCIVANNAGSGVSMSTVENCLIVNNKGETIGDDVYYYLFGNFKNSVMWGDIVNPTILSIDITNCALENGVLSDTITVALSHENMTFNGPQFLKPTQFIGPDSTKTEEILSADWSVWETTALHDSQATFIKRVPVTTALTLIEASGDSGKVPSGTTVTVQALFKTGQTLNHWASDELILSEDSKAQNPLTFVMPEQSVTLTANYRDALKYQLTVIGAPGTDSCYEGSLVNISANPNTPDSLFLEWEASGITISDPTQKALRFIMPNHDVTLTAHYCAVQNGTVAYLPDPNNDSVYHGNHLNKLINLVAQNNEIDTILLGEGTYLGNFKIKGKIEIYGGFPATLDPDQWDITNPLRDSRLTRCDGNQAGSVFAHDPKVIYTIPDTIILDGLTIQNGKSRWGGGVDFERMSSGVVNHCIITNNTASYGGGIGGNMFAGYGKVTNSIITNNIAENDGGGAGYCILTNCIITNNTSTEYAGGALYSTLTNCIISNNTAMYGGGALYSTLTNCIISNNTAMYGGGICGGGGIMSEYGKVTNSIISNNTASYGGGAYSTALTNCLIANNSAQKYESEWGTEGGSGGGTYRCSIDNCVLWGNDAVDDPQCSVSDFYNCAVQDAVADDVEITVSLSADNMDAESGPKFLNPSPFVGADTSRTEEVLAANWSMYDNTAVLPSQANFLTRVVTVTLPILSILNGTATDSGEVEPGTEITATANPAEVGQMFDQWIVIVGTFPADADSAEATITFAMPDTHLTLEATYKPIPKYNVFVKNGSSDNDSVLEGETITVTADEYQDSTFTHWTSEDVDLTDSAIDNPLVFIMPAHDVTLTANYFDNPKNLWKIVPVDPDDKVTNGDNLKRIIDNATGPGTILLAEGTYLGNFKIKNGIQIYGGFTDDTWNWATRDSTLTICDGDETGSVFEQWGIFSDTPILDGLTIQNGIAATNAFGDSYGGGIYAWSLYVQDTTVAINNCVITNNEAKYGGGVYAGNVTNCIISNNSAEHGGGTRDGNVTNCIITKNQARRYGGGVYARNVTNCIITKNQAKYGGGVYAGNVTNCIISNNSAEHGGGVYAGNVTNCIISNNSAEDGGGTRDGNVVNCTIINNTASMGGGTRDGNVVNCIISNNTTTGYAGGTAKSTVTNCIITNNTAQYGGGVFRGNLTNCIIANNKAEDWSGGVILWGDGTASNCVLWGNTASRAPQCEDDPKEYKSNLKNCAVQDMEKDPTAITVSLDAENRAERGPKFVNPSPFVGADISRTEEVLAADWRMYDNTTVLPTQADFFARVSTDALPRLTIENGTSPIFGKIPAGTEITVTADSAPYGMMFDYWEIVTGEIYIDETMNPLSFEMPDADVTLKATYTVAPKYTLTVHAGKADKDSVFFGEMVTVTANEPEEGFIFDSWIILEGDLDVDFSESTIRFAMPNNNVELEATYIEFEGEPMVVVNQCATPVWKDAPLSASKLSATAVLENGQRVTPRMVWLNKNEKVTQSGYYTFKAIVPGYQTFIDSVFVGTQTKLTPTFVSAKFDLDSFQVDIMAKDNARQVEADNTVLALYRYAMGETIANAKRVDVTRSTPKTNIRLTDSNLVPGTAYYYAVKAHANMNFEGASVASAARLVKVPAKAPRNFMAESLGSQSLLVKTWFDAPDTRATYQYAIHRYDSAKKKSLGLVSAWSVDTTIIFAENKKYAGKNMAYVAVAQEITKKTAVSGFSDSAFVTIGTPPATVTPVVPIDAPIVSVSDSDFDCIRVSWHNPKGYYASVTRYIETKNGPVENKKFANVIYSTLIDATPTPGVSMWYEVKFSDNPKGASPGPGSGRKWGVRPIVKAQNLGATKGTLNDAVKLTWKMSKGTITGKVYRSENSDMSDSEVITNGWEKMSTTFTDKGKWKYLVRGKTYYYSIVLASSGGANPSAVSDTVAGWAALTPPISITATRGESTDYVTIEWVVNPNISQPERTGFIVGRAPSAKGIKDPAFETFYVEGADETRFDDETAIPGQTYFYYVCATAGNETDMATTLWKGPAKGFKRLSPPPLVFATDAEYYDRIIVSWNESKGAKYYRVYRSESGAEALGEAELLTKQAITAREFIDWDLKIEPEIYYYYFVEASVTPSAPPALRSEIEGTEVAGALAALYSNREDQCISQGIPIEINVRDIAYGHVNDERPSFTPVKEKIKMSAITPTASFHYSITTDEIVNDKVKVLNRKIMLNSAAFNNATRTSDSVVVWNPTLIQGELGGNGDGSYEIEGGRLLIHTSKNDSAYAYRPDETKPAARTYRTGFSYFRVNFPEIDYNESDLYVDISNGNQWITLGGYYFGKNLPTVWVEHEVDDGKARKVPLSTRVVQSGWIKGTNSLPVTQSLIQKDDGSSKIEVYIPGAAWAKRKKWPGMSEAGLPPFSIHIKVGKNTTGTEMSIDNSTDW